MIGDGKEMAVETKGINFEELVEQNEQRVHYQVHKLRQDDQRKEFYHGGIFAKWHAYKKYMPYDGILPTYFNYVIRERLNDCVEKGTEPYEDWYLVNSDYAFFDIYWRTVKRVDRCAKMVNAWLNDSASLDGCAVVYGN